MKHLKLAAAPAVVAALLLTSACGGTTTIAGKKVPTDAKAVCKLLKSNTDDSSSGDSGFSSKEYQEFIAWADAVDDKDLSKDLRSLGTLAKQMPSDGASSSSDGGGAFAVGMEILGVYNSVMADCAKHGVTLPNPMDDTTGNTSSSASPSAAATKPLGFGSTKTYDDRLAITVGAPVPFKPGTYGSAAKAPVYVKFQITIDNGTGATYDPSMIDAALQAGSTDEDQVFDSANGIGDTPHAKLLAGRSAVFWVGFGVPDTSDLVLDITPDYDHDDAIFATSAGSDAQTTSTAGSPAN